MMRLERKAHPDPAAFKRAVQVPGLEALQALPAGSRPDETFWKRHGYWRKSESLDTLWEVYGGVCAYTCLSSRPKEGRSVDHVQPKSLRPEAAYDWDNFLPAQVDVNRLKSDHEDVLDPREIEEGWFRLEIPLMVLMAAGDAATAAARRVGDATPGTTIARLKLGEPELTYAARVKSEVKKLLANPARFPATQEDAPFVVRELVGQGYFTEDGRITAKGEQLRDRLIPPPPAADALRRS